MMRWMRSPISRYCAGASPSLARTAASPFFVNMWAALLPVWRGALGEENLLAKRRVTPGFKIWMVLDNNSCQGYHLLVLGIHVIDDPAAATVALEPTRRRLLSHLATPASAATLATRVGLPRQKVNYHLRALEAHGLVRLAQERKWGELTERLLVATAASYVVSPVALGPVAVDPNREVDRLSASYLIDLGSRVVREVGDLVRRAQEAG